ncbi:MAG: polysaccharide lyase 11 [Armatimonadota bacterium]
MSIRLEKLLEVSVGSPIGQCRARAVTLGEGEPRAFLVAWCGDFDVDPYTEMFFFPTDTLKLAVITEEGEELWRRDLGPGVVPGHWFCPVAAFDLDGDGASECWFVNNLTPEHPLGLGGYRLECLDARTGATVGQWPWPEVKRGQSLSHLFRNFIVGGRARGEPVLITAQGTYGDMHLQGWSTGMVERWRHDIAADAPGARGSHMTPVADINEDGVDELMWGERCIELDRGAELWCADRDSYRGHSDVIWPFRNPDGPGWLIYTCREGDRDVSPRVVCYDAEGERVWGAVDAGHMDMGWVANLGEGGRPVAMAIRIGHKTCGPDGRHHFDRDEFVFDAATGAPVELPFGVYGTLPVDLDGDGVHELVYGIAGQDGRVIDRLGAELGCTGGPSALCGNLMPRPGEQILSYHEDGRLGVWGDANAGG